MSDCASKACGCGQPASPFVAAPVALAAGQTRTTLAIARMDCPTEEALIRRQLASVAGVAALDFNLLQRTLTLTHAPEALAPVITAIRSLGMEAVVQGGEAAS